MEYGRLMARVAVLDVIERYFAAIDAADKSLLASCFAKDAHFESSGGTLDLTGREVIAARLASGRYPITTHVRGNTIVTMTDLGADAETRAVATLVERNDGSGRIMVRGLRYVDQLVEADGSWLIRHRRHFTLWQGDVDAVLAFVP